jgi:MoaA/NifB/PqqE/SkfB family radical SAM enzyme
MLRQYLQLAWMLATPSVTRVPRRVFRELSRRGHERLPREVRRSLNRFLPGLRGLRFIHQWMSGERITRHAGQWVINSFLPPFPGRAYGRMFENLLSGRRLSPVSAFLAITSECPYQCWHCSHKRRSAGNLSTAEWLRIISQANRLGASVIGFTGGEPCLHPDLPEMVAAASNGGAATILFSSGACMDTGLLARLKEAGLWSVCVSVDHPDARRHDELRGAPGAHARALEMLQTARGHGFYTMIGCVGAREIIPHLPEMHQLAGRLGVHELRIVEPMPCGLLGSGNGEVFLNPDETDKLRRFHVDTNRRAAPPKVCAFNQIESPEVFGCGAGTQHLFIDSRGEVCPCDFTAMSFGNAVAEPLDGIWSRMSDAMGNPRRHCFARKHHKLILSHADGVFPLCPEKSARVCAEAGAEDLPDYFKQMLGRTR